MRSRLERSSPDRDAACSRLVTSRIRRCDANVVAQQARLSLLPTRNQIDPGRIHTWVSLVTAVGGCGSNARDDRIAVSRAAVHAAIRDASFIAAAHAPDFRIVHLSIQRTHLHLIVEATHRTALSKGMQGFLISAARGINRALEKRGTVFADRYHTRALRTPREVRNCIAYVLNNWRRHGEDRERRWKLDPFASGISFDGWKELEDRVFGFRPPPTYASLIVWLPKTWLPATGWRKHGRIGAFEVPGGDE